jgi:hypothetical protein
MAVLMWKGIEVSVHGDFDHLRRRLHFDYVKTLKMLIKTADLAL